MIDLPIAVIGAGPVGLAAAPRPGSRGLVRVVFERGILVGTASADWAHVRLFSSWKYNVDAEARRLLEGSSWAMPDPGLLPGGR